MESESGKVSVTKAGIKELLGKIRHLESEVEERDEVLRGFIVKREQENETYKQKITELQRYKTAYENSEESSKKNHQAEIKKLQAELNTKSKLADEASSELLTLKCQLINKEDTIRELRKSLDQKNTSGKDLADLQKKHGEATIELNKYKSVPILKDILKAKELLSQFEDKVAKTSLLQDNFEQTEKRCETYKSEVERGKAANAKLFQNRAVSSEKYNNQNVETLESQIRVLRDENTDAILTKVKRLYEIALLTSELPDKMNKDIASVGDEVIASLKMREEELNKLANTSIILANFRSQEKKYKEVLTLLECEKTLFQLIPEAKKSPKKSATDRVEDLRGGQRTTENSGGENRALNELKQKCDELLVKYGKRESPESSRKTDDDVTDCSKQTGSTGWTFDFLNNKDDDLKKN